MTRAARAHPNIEILVRICRRVVLLTLHEPFVLVGCVIGYQIHDYVHSSLMHLFDQCVKVLHLAQHGINVVEGDNVVAVVLAARQIDRVEPDDVNTNVRQVVQL